MTAKGCEGPFRGEGNVLHLDQGIKVITCTLKIHEFYYILYFKILISMSHLESISSTEKQEATKYQIYSFAYLCLL